MPYILGIRGAVAENLLGKVFGRLTIIERDFTKKVRPYWFCKCGCGTIKSVATVELKSGKTKSCGCLNDEDKKARLITHGLSRTPTYVCWTNMRNRCLKSSEKSYPSYGGRGIKVCERWLNSFENFYEDMGEKPKKLTLERIDVNGNYEKSNCKWATAKEQANNKRISIRANYQGSHYTASQLSELLNISYNKVVWAIKRYGDEWQSYLTKAAEIGKGM